MFGYLMANGSELSKQQRRRYSAIYCGICRNIRDTASHTARLGLRYDMAFLALLLMSLYEPEEYGGSHACILHPLRPWTDNEYIRYAADMNVALAYYKCKDDIEDDGALGAKLMAPVFEAGMDGVRQRYPRQCRAIEEGIAQLAQLEKDGCNSPDQVAGCFGQLMAQLLTYRQDLWEPTLHEMGMALGRFIYLADAAVDYRRDKKKDRYNPFLAMGMGEDWQAWEQYLVLAMGRCTDYYERLPLVQDKAILDNILYSGIWLEYRRRQGRQASREVQDDR